MKIVIRKGRHSPFLLQRIRQIGLSIDRKKMERIVEFNDTAKYDHPGTYDDEDVNKLFGFAYTDGGAHEDSIRFGWNWNNDTNKIRLYAYYYVDGEMGFIKLCEIRTYWAYLLSIEKIGNVCSLTVFDARQTWIIYGGQDIVFYHCKRVSYNLGSFFGGQLPATHDINYKLSKK